MLCVQVACRVARGFPSELLAELLAPNFPRWTIQAIFDFPAPMEISLTRQIQPFFHLDFCSVGSNHSICAMLPPSASLMTMWNGGQLFIWGAYSPTCFETGTISGIFGSEAKSLWGPVPLICCLCSNHKDHRLALLEKTYSRRARAASQHAAWLPSR